MTGVERRDVILGALRASAEPLSGGALARSVGVSRQVVVQDIALLRADGHDIAATNRGYVLHEGEETSRPVRLFKVLHTAEELEDELTCVVDLGGEVLDVTVSHRVYGKITAPLHVRSRRDVERYLEGIRTGKSSPLMTVTSGYHYHRIAADSTEVLDEVEDALRTRGYLAPVLPYERDAMAPAAARGAASS